MKKVTGLILVMVMVVMFSGCSSQKTEEERKAEIKEELMTEIAEKEKESNDTKETPVIGENTSKEDQGFVLKGKLILTGTELGHGILLDRKKDIGGNLVEQVYFNEKNSVMDFIPRKYLTFYFEGRTSLKEELSGEIPIEIKVDPDSFIYDIDRDLGWIDVLKVISADGEMNPVDKSADEYPDQYYMDVFNHLLQSLGVQVREPDIRDMEVYQSGGEFKEAVDKLMDRGYSIKMGADRYYITEIK